MRKIMIALMLWGFLTGIALGTPYMAISTYDQWQEMLAPPSGHNRIEALGSTEWGDYMLQWQAFLEEGDPYPTTTFSNAYLEASPNGLGGDPEIIPPDSGLVMVWGNDLVGPGEFASAWKMEYGLDPDLSNKTIKVTVTPPQWGANGQIAQVSFGMTDSMGRIRSWYWNCGNGPGQLPWNMPTTITINTAIAGIGAANPPAAGYMNNPGFDITQVISFILDENAVWIGGPLPIPPIQTPVPGFWNYWHDLIILPNQTHANKGTYIKYSQPIDEFEPGLINGWDEPSIYPPFTIGYPIMADDFPCKDERPITDLHWWGSFLGWNEPYLPQEAIPLTFHIGIWTDVPADDPGNPFGFSHPGVMIWEHICDNWVWNFAGFDVPPQGAPYPYENEACFQFNQLLSEPDWFWQEPGENIYWLSIAAIYPGTDVVYPWGWKTRPHYYMDDAVRTFATMPWPPVRNAVWEHGEPLELHGESWDLAFEITTNVPDYCDNPIPGDLNCDKIVNLLDFAIFASNWLSVAP
ncbi:MAG: hypothetical protein JW709_06585 [Sedimentisphaerales bacterium]|nr:hypothetical protein [Sedimentisphaerales bacterium]